MMHDLQVQMQAHSAKGYPKRKLLVVRDMEKEYMNPLAKLCGIETLPDYIFNIAHDSYEVYKTQPSEMRKYKYIVVDSSNFTRIKVQ